LFEEDGLRIGELGRRARLAKQTMTTMIRLMERDGLVIREPDPDDGRATRVRLTVRARRFRPVAEKALAELDDLVIRTLGATRSQLLAEDLEEVLAI
jgi:DNA-binding MarR family transcriptional regulator